MPHICSQENHPVLFHNEDEFKAAMNAVAFAALLFPDVKIFTFVIMDNHFHFAIVGEKSEIKLLLRALVNKLASLPSLAVARNDIRKLDFKFFDIGSLDNMRNVVAYINRNGAVVNPNESVYTYKWGANRFFFNTEAKLRFKSCGIKLTCREKRGVFHSELVNNENRIFVLDGYVSPLCFCEVSKAESFFRSNRHYFYCISKNIEASKDIALNIGEHIFYSDEELYAYIMALCSKKYSCDSIRFLSKEAKIELAKELHFDFRVGNKQISRLLKIDLTIISAMFPE